jgi:rhodanese-related sulfurtransferase
MTMKTIIPTLVLVLSLALLTACQAEPGKSAIQLSPQDFSQQIKAKGDSVLLIDVRTPGEFRSGHIPGALSIDINGPDFAGEVAKLPKDKQVFVYCRSGRRSQASVAVFFQAGFENVANLTHGIGDWQDAGLPIQRD